MGCITSKSARDNHAQVPQPVRPTHTTPVRVPVVEVKAGVERHVANTQHQPVPVAVGTAPSSDPPHAAELRVSDRKEVAQSIPPEPVDIATTSSDVTQPLPANGASAAPHTASLSDSEEGETPRSASNEPVAIATAPSDDTAEHSDAQSTASLNVSKEQDASRSVPEQSSGIATASLDGTKPLPTAELSAVLHATSLPVSDTDEATQPIPVDPVGIATASSDVTNPLPAALNSDAPNTASLSVSKEEDAPESVPAEPLGIDTASSDNTNPLTATGFSTAPLADSMCVSDTEEATQSACEEPVRIPSESSDDTPPLPDAPYSDPMQHASLRVSEEGEIPRSALDEPVDIATASSDVTQPLPAALYSDSGAPQTTSLPISDTGEAAQSIPVEPKAIAAAPSDDTTSLSAAPHSDAPNTASLRVSDREEASQSVTAEPAAPIIASSDDISSTVPDMNLTTEEGTPSATQKNAEQAGSMSGAETIPVTHIPLPIDEAASRIPAAPSHTPPQLHTIGADVSSPVVRSMENETAALPCPGPVKVTATTASEDPKATMPSSDGEKEADVGSGAAWNAVLSLPGDKPSQVCAGGVAELPTEEVAIAAVSSKAPSVGNPIAQVPAEEPSHAMPAMENVIVSFPNPVQATASSAPKHAVTTPVSDEIILTDAEDTEARNAISAPSDDNSSHVRAAYVEAELPTEEAIEDRPVLESVPIDRLDHSHTQGDIISSTDTGDVVYPIISKSKVLQSPSTAPVSDTPHATSLSASDREGMSPLNFYKQGGTAVSPEEVSQSIPDEPISIVTSSSDDKNEAIAVVGHSSEEWIPSDAQESTEQQPMSSTETNRSAQFPLASHEVKDYEPSVPSFASSPLPTTSHVPVEMPNHSVPTMGNETTIVTSPVQAMAVSVSEPEIETTASSDEKHLPNAEDTELEDAVSSLSVDRSSQLHNNSVAELPEAIRNQQVSALVPRESGVSCISASTFAETQVTESVSASDASSDKSLLRAFSAEERAPVDGDKECMVEATLAEKTQSAPSDGMAASYSADKAAAVTDVDNSLAENAPFAAQEKEEQLETGSNAVNHVLSAPSATSEVANSNAESDEGLAKGSTRYDTSPTNADSTTQVVENDLNSPTLGKPPKSSHRASPGTDDLPTFVVAKSPDVSQPASSSNTTALREVKLQSDFEKGTATLLKSEVAPTPLPVPRKYIKAMRTIGKANANNVSVRPDLDALSKNPEPHTVSRDREDPGISLLSDASSKRVEFGMEQAFGTNNTLFQPLAPSKSALGSKISQSSPEKETDVVFSVGSTSPSQSSFFRKGNKKESLGTQQGFAAPRSPANVAPKSASETISQGFGFDLTPPNSGKVAAPFGENTVQAGNSEPSKANGDIGFAENVNVDKRDEHMSQTTASIFGATRTQALFPPKPSLPERKEHPKVEETVREEKKANENAGDYDFESSSRTLASTADVLSDADDASVSTKPEEDSDADDASISTKPEEESEEESIPSKTEAFTTRTWNYKSPYRGECDEYVLNNPPTGLSSGTNSSGNRWTNLGNGAYHYSNYGTDGGFYIKNEDGSTYHFSPAMGGRYTESRSAASSFSYSKVEYLTPKFEEKRWDYQSPYRGECDDFVWKNPPPDLGYGSGWNRYGNKYTTLGNGGYHYQNKGSDGGFYIRNSDGSSYHFSPSRGGSYRPAY